MNAGGRQSQSELHERYKACTGHRQQQSGHLQRVNNRINSLNLLSRNQEIPSGHKERSMMKRVDAEPASSRKRAMLDNSVFAWNVNSIRARVVLSLVDVNCTRKRLIRVHLRFDLSVCPICCFKFTLWLLFIMFSSLLCKLFPSDFVKIS